jgi:hypothetical protein
MHSPTNYFSKVRLWEKAGFASETTKSEAELQAAEALIEIFSFSADYSMRIRPSPSSI